MERRVVVGQGFQAGRNIAMKVPPHEYAATLRFYREVLGLPELTPSQPGETPRFDFGGKTLWIDQVPGCSQAEIWLEVTHPNPAEAADALQAAGVVRCDAIEPLPEDFSGYWIASPCNIVHLVSGRAATVP